MEPVSLDFSAQTRERHLLYLQRAQEELAAKAEAYLDKNSPSDS